MGDTIAASDPDLRPSSSLIGDPAAPPGAIARGNSIGRFVVLGVLGSGGMGVVHSAYDPHLDRKVAIKLLSGAAMRTQDAAIRLLREAQAMAKINHPNVIKVHEVGTHGEQVFIAMEFADAGTLRGWLKEKHSREEILAVFAEAGRGLAAAHSVGLVHRDFKPDNVLMSKDGSIRVTDFGLVSVADAPLPRAATDLPVPTDVKLTDDTPLSQDLTRTGSIMGTPTYMAPEQFSGRASTAQTDQFAFCVALYEALYGERPYAAENYAELSAAVLMGELRPAPKDTHVPAWMRRALLRGLATDPANRYRSMADLLAALSADPSRRRRKLFAVVASIAFVALGALALFTLRKGANAECRAGGERFDAVWNADKRAKIQSALAATKRPHAAATFERLTKIVDDWGNAWQASYLDACEDTRVRGEQSDRLLDLRMQCLTRRLDDTRATLDLFAAGGPDVADKALSAALALPTVAPCSDAAALTASVPPPETQATRAQVTAVRTELDDARAKRRVARYADGLGVARDALAKARASNYQPVIAEALLAVGQLESDLADKNSIATLRDAMHAAASSGDSATMIDASAWLMYVLTNETDQYAVASEVGLLADAMAKHARPPVDVVVRLDNTIGLLQAKQGDVKSAQARYEGALALAQKELGADHPGTLTTLNQLGNLAKQQGRFADARKYLEQVVASRERVLGKDHPDVASALNNLGNVYRVEGKLDDAKQLYERSLAIRIAALGPTHPDVGTSYNNLGTFYSEAGDEVKALEQFDKALAVWEQAYGKDHIELTAALGNIGSSLNARGDRAGARAMFERSRKIIEKAKGPEHPDVAAVLSNLGVVALDENKLDEAFDLFTRAEKIAEKAYGPEHPDVADYLENLTTVYKHQGKLREAKEMTSRSLALIAKAYGQDHTRMGGALVNYASLQIALDDKVGALETFKRSLAIFEAKLGKDHPYVAFALNGIGGTLVELKRNAEAVPYLERALAIRVATEQQASDLAEVRWNLALALIASPKTRARAINEAKTALDDYKKADDAEKVKELTAWLRHPD
ncbi:MAG TPA: serine/threonine-protein kinase [Kofleriaceae bacterium]|nr:serine/threonine-protein kinase [Kofleriaceae bacterium]